MYHGIRGFEPERVRSLGVLRSFRSKPTVAAGKRWETHFLGNEEKEEWIEDYVERETAVATKWVEDAETTIEQVQDALRNAEKTGLTTTKPESTLEEMLNAIGDCMSDFSSSNNEEDGEDEDDDEEDLAGGKLSDDDEPGWVMGTIPETVKYHMEHFRQKQMKLDEMTQPGWGDSADYFRDGDRKYWTTELKGLAVVQLQTPDDAESSAPITYGEPMETLDSIPTKLLTPLVTSRPGSSHTGPGSQKPQTDERIPSLPPTPMPDWSQNHKSN